MICYLDVEVVSLSPQLLLKRKAGEAGRKLVFVCPEPSCLHHDPSHGLGDLVGMKKHFRRKHSNTASGPATAAPKFTPPTPATAAASPPESSCHQTTSFKLLGALIELPEQVCGALECDARENVGTSSALHDQSLQVGSVLETRRAEDPESMVWTASDRPPEPSRQGVEWSAPSTPKPKAYKHEVVMRVKNDSSDFDPFFTNAERSCITD